MATRTSKKKIDFQKNFKKSTAEAEITKDLWGLLAGLTWLLPASFLKLSGWGGFALASVGTWLTGALFDIEAMRRSALAVGAVHLLYSKGSKTIQDNLNVSLWRMGEEFTETPAKVEEKVGSLRGLSNGFNSPTQTGSSSVMTLPNHSQLVRRAAEPMTMERSLPPVPTITPSVPIVANTDSMMGLNGLNGYNTTASKVENVELLPSKGLGTVQSVYDRKSNIDFLPVRARA